MLQLSKLFTGNTILKICGITNAVDAERLIESGVEALGFNFWPQSKRYISPDTAATFSIPLQHKILRIGVFVNASQDEILDLLERNIIDVAQLHGDEDVGYCQQFAKLGYPFIKAIGVANSESLNNITDYQASAILLDAHAPDVYGGTGNTFDWNLAKDFITKHPDLPVILAGGITAENAENAFHTVHPYAIDVASGAETSPGIKDFNKVLAIQNSLK